MVSRRTLAVLGTVFIVLVFLGVLVGYWFWDGLQSGDVVKALAGTTIFAVLWVIASVRAYRR